MLEHQQSQLVNGLQELYACIITGQGWEAPLLNEASNGRPLTHDILESLGVLAQEPQPNFGTFDEDTDAMQKQLLRGGADMVQRWQSDDTECDQESVQSSFESAACPSSITQPYATAQLPTPPSQSPESLQSKGVSSRTSLHAMQKPTQVRPQSLQIQPGYTNWDTSMNPASTQNWAESPNTYDSYISTDCYPPFNGLDSAQTSAGNVSMPDWAEIDFNSFLNTTMT